MGQFLEHIDRSKRIVEIITIIGLYGVGGVFAWYLGGSFGFDSTGQILLVALILCTFPIALIITYYLKKRSEKNLTVATSDQSKEDHPELVQRAEEVLQWLKSTKLASKSTHEIIYQLPWFLLLGQSASGKTSLVLNSGLQLQNLPSQKNLEQNALHHTNSCEWYVSNSAILIDTAGNYLNDNGNHNEWLALLDTIKKYRLERPINGLIVTVAIPEVLKANDNEIEQQAKLLRARIDEVKAKFKISFPIYLVFTHADLIDGFKVFFTPFDKKKRSQIWGATIPLAQREQAHALFDTEFDYLCDSLMSNRFMRLKLSGSSQEQLAVFDFPIKFATLRNKMGLFISALFRPNPFSENPWLRGFYLTGSVEGHPSSLTKEASEDYFITDLFKEQLIEDASLVEALGKKQKPELKRKILVAATAIISVFLILAFSVSLIKNRFLISEGLEKGLQVDEITRLQSAQVATNRDIAAMRVELEAMEGLRVKLELLDNYQKSTPLSYRYGLYSGNAINPNLRAIYFDLLNQRFFQQTAANLEADLRVFADNKDKFSEEELGKNYDLLKAYLMLSDPSKTEPTFLANQLSKYWKKCYPSDLELLAQQQLDFYAKQAIYEDAPHFKVDDKIVVVARQHLTSYPAVNRFFKRVTSEIDTKVKPVTLDSITQGRSKGWVVAKYSVPGSFTIQGYQQHMKVALASAAEEMSKEDWVMGASAVTTKDLSSDLGKLEGIYFHEYINQWQYFLRGLSVPAYKTKEEAVEALKVLSASDSPLALALTKAAEQTNFTKAQQQVSWWEKLFGRNTIKQTPQIMEVEKEFLPLSQFVGKEGETENSLLSQYRASLRTVLDSLESITADQLSQTTKMLLTGKDDIGLLKAELTVNKLVDNFATSATKDASLACKQPLGNLRAMLYGGSYAQIEQSWQEQIYPKAHSLEEGFPFTETGNASITDLTRYLNPVNGLLAQFFNDRLTSSFEEAQGKWRLKENGAFKFSQEFIDYLNNSRQLREALFAQGGQQMEVSYELLLQPLGSADIVIEIDGTRVETRGTTAQAAKFIWPAKSGTAGAKITVIQGNKIVEKAFPGEWGLFKMLTAGGATQSEGNQISLSWGLEGTSVRAVLKPSSNTNPFLRRLFTQWHAPKNLR